ncbi:MAG TPA: hypothetical protein VN755_12600, partial [Steroidobacteraceae bacterium]|nr:hypothetical protein [Steroidobacteraceae bacterium]
LALAQSAKAVQSFVQLHQIITLLIGPQAAAAAYKMDTLMPWLREQVGADERLFKSPAELLKSMQDSAQAMAGLQQQAAQQQAQPQGGPPPGAPMQ